MESARKKLQWEVWAEKLGVSHKEALKLGESFSSKDSGVILRKRSEPSPDLLISLFPYQKEFLAWAINQEKSWIKGGILADETGMGKTIQALSLILTSSYLKSRPLMTQTNKKQNIISGSLSLPQVKATLVIGPTITIEHWQNEISRYTKQGSVKVMIYNSPRGTVTINELSEYDIVLTTYSTVHTEHTKSCGCCGMRFHPAYLERTICGPCESSIKYQSNLETLAMVASLKQECVNGKEGSKNKSKGKFDYSSEYLSPMLYSVKWDRLILDESQCKADDCINLSAIPMLQSNYKWALTGNPLENTNLVEPFSYQYCDECDWKKLDSRHIDGCKCPHSDYGHFSWWTKYVTRSPCATSHPKRIMLLKHRVLDPIFLRRTKHERAAGQAFPPRTVFVRRDSLTTREEEFYRSWNPMDIIAATMRNCDKLNLLHKLRQAADHPYLVVYEQNRCDLSPTGYVCDGCHINIGNIRSCKHPCTLCSINHDNTTNGECPECDENLSIAQRVKKALGIKRASILDQSDLRKLQTSTKTDALSTALLNRREGVESFMTAQIENLQKEVKSPQAALDELIEEIMLMSMNDASSKGVVFSHFSEFLDLIGFFLEKSGIKCIILDNYMKFNDMKESLEIFANDVECKVILMSIKAGAAALDLTVASHVFLMDPWWSPIPEKQAEGRIFRLGQHKPVKVVRFIIENTVEEHILNLQENRAPDYEGPMNHSPTHPDRIYINDLQLILEKDGIGS